jgi:hypothetical protein
MGYFLAFLLGVALSPVLFTGVVAVIACVTDFLEGGRQAREAERNRRLRIKASHVNQMTREPTHALD